MSRCFVNLLADVLKLYYKQVATTTTTTTEKKFGHALIRATTLHVKRPSITSQQEPRKPDQTGHNPRKK